MDTNMNMNKKEEKKISILTEIKNNLKWSHYINYVLVLVTIAVIVGLDSVGALNSTNKDLFVKTGYYAILTVSLNLIVGFLGELSLGHAALMCVGAYAGGIVAKALASLPTIVMFPVSLLAGAVAGALFGALMGLPSLRLRGDYVAIITLAFTQIIKNAADNLTPITGGAAGLKGVPIKTNYLNCFIVLFVCLIIAQNFIKSKHGRIVRAIRDNSIAASACGVSIAKYKILVFCFAGALAGIAGALATMYRGAVYPNNYTYNESINILVMVVLGGMGNITGSLISAAILTFVPQYLKVIGFTDAYRMVAYAVILIVIMILNNMTWFKRIKANISVTLSNITEEHKKKRAELREMAEKQLVRQVAEKNANDEVLLRSGFKESKRPSHRHGRRG